MEEKMLRSGSGFFEISPNIEANGMKPTDIASNQANVMMSGDMSRYETIKQDFVKSDTIKSIDATGTAVKDYGKDDGECGYRTGDLPSCAPLAAAFVPKQRSADPRYDANEALSRGTLFPGLDLPFMNIANKGNPYAGTPLGELMAISFISHELTLYLDTHPKDTEAFALLQSMLRLKAEAHKRYTARFGAVTPDDLVDAQDFNWVHGPWPWEYSESGGKAGM